MSLFKKNTILILIACVIVIIPLIMLKGTEFNGTDGQGVEIIENVAPDYKPWFSNILELPGPEIETFVFSIQAALGAGVAGFIIGRMTAGKGEKG